MYLTICEVLCRSFEDVERVVVVEVAGQRSALRVEQDVQAERVDVAVGVRVGLEIGRTNQSAKLISEAKRPRTRRVGHAADCRADSETTGILHDIVTREHQVVGETQVSPILERTFGFLRLIRGRHLGGDEAKTGQGSRADLAE